MTMANILAFTTPADAPRPETMSDALKLLTALGDPKGTAAAVKRLSEAAAEAREQIAEAEAVLADLDRKSAALDQRFATVDDVIAKKAGRCGPAHRR
jgi:hypothetical protein